VREAKYGEGSACQPHVRARAGPDVVEVSWRPGYLHSSTRLRGSESVPRETRPNQTLPYKWGGGGEGGCLAKPTHPSCVSYLGLVCAACLQTAAINVIVRRCSRLKRRSRFSAPGLQSARAGFASPCFSFPNVNAALESHRSVCAGGRSPFPSFLSLDRIQSASAPRRPRCSFRKRACVRIQGDVEIQRTRFGKQERFLRRQRASPTRSAG